LFVLLIVFACFAFSLIDRLIKFWQYNTDVIIFLGFWIKVID
jgi:hypothetical protein